MPSRPARTKRVSLLLAVAAVGVDPNYEPVTRAAAQYREANVYPYLQAKGFLVIKFPGALARRYDVAPEVKKPGVEYLMGVGHGGYNLFTGDQGDIVFQIGHYQPDEAKGKIVHLLSCQTARELGPDFVAKGARAFFGYDENFSFTMAEKELFF